jgi:ketosteroid isomerase-like protein
MSSFAHGSPISGDIAKGTRDVSVPVRRKIEVVTDFLDRTGNLDFDGAGQLLAENAVMIMPFVDEMPRLEGRTAIIDQMRSVIPRMFERMNFAYDAWYDVCNEDDTLIAEYHSECPWTGGTGTYRNSYITVFRFEGDKIALYKEYLNPMRMKRFGVSSDGWDAPG